MSRSSPRPAGPPAPALDSQLAGPVDLARHLGAGLHSRCGRRQGWPRGLQPRSTLMRTRSRIIHQVGTSPLLGRGRLHLRHAHHEGRALSARLSGVELGGVVAVAGKNQVEAHALWYASAEQDLDADVEPVTVQGACQAQARDRGQHALGRPRPALHEHRHAVVAGALQPRWTMRGPPPVRGRARPSRADRADERSAACSSGTNTQARKRTRARVPAWRSGRRSLALCAGSARAPPALHPGRRLEELAQLFFEGDHSQHPLVLGLARSSWVMASFLAARSVWSRTSPPTRLRRSIQGYLPPARCSPSPRRCIRHFSRYVARAPSPSACRPIRPPEPRALLRAIAAFMRCCPMPLTKRLLRWPTYNRANRGRWLRPRRGSSAPSRSSEIRACSGLVGPVVTRTPNRSPDDPGSSSSASTSHSGLASRCRSLAPNVAQGQSRSSRAGLRPSASATRGHGRGPQAERSRALRRTPSRMRARTLGSITPSVRQPALRRRGARA